MSKKQVIVQSNYIIYDDEGHALSPGMTFTVKDGPMVADYLEKGLLTFVSEDDAAEAPKEEARKPQPQKSRPQPSEDLTQQENANG